MHKKKFKLLILPSVKNITRVVESFPFPIDLTEGKFKDLEFSFQDEEMKVTINGLDLKEFSLVWLSSSWTSRDLAYAIKLYLKKAKTPCTYVEKGTSKITDQVLFSLNKIKTPNTLFLGSKKIELNLDRIKEVCKYPIIVKDAKGSRGVDSIFVKNDKDLTEKMKKLPKYKKYLFQEFIPNDYDWGILVANGKVVSGERSYSCLGEFRNNTCNGAEEVFIDPKDIPLEIKEIALKASKVVGLSWSRSDIIIDKNTQIPYLMETNRLPGITAKTTEAEGVYQFLAHHIKLSKKQYQN